jgi:hypothetical protein
MHPKPFTITYDNDLFQWIIQDANNVFIAMVGVGAVGELIVEAMNASELFDPVAER